MGLILAIVALVIFVLAAFNVTIGTVTLVPLGLAFLTAALIVGISLPAGALALRR